VAKRTEDLGAAKARFVEQYGLLSEREGLSRIAGRIFALMLVDPGPLSFSQLAERLEVSRASISTNTHLLEGFGIIERVTKPGDRQDYFQLLPDTWLGVLKRHIANHARRRQIIEELLENEDALPPDGAERVRKLMRFTNAAIESAENLIREVGTASKVSSGRDI
jgi:DNA-binding transcriptional regulator GbsR (MarR family)